jgi:hypothetical protein
VTEGETCLRLIAYYRCAGHGFAMPLYGLAEGANNLYLAISSMTGDHRATITSFEPILVDERRNLPHGESIEVKVGQPWRDVFLWNDAAFVGTPEEIWAELTTSHPDLEARAPLSMLDLAVHAGRPDVDRIAPSAMTFVTERFGQPRARGWRRQFLRQQVEIGLRWALADAKLEDAEFRSVALAEEVGGVRLDMSRALADALHSSDAGRQAMEAVAGLAAMLDASLSPPRRELREAAAPALADMPILDEPYEEAANVERDVAAADQPHDPAEEPQALGPVTIVPIGKRARSVANHLRSARNRDLRFDNGEFRIMSRPHGDLIDGRPQSPQTLILIIDDEETKRGQLPGDIEDLMAEHAANGSLVLLAPALPATRPSALFEEMDFLSPPRRAAHAVLDTAIARSPFWWGNAKRSFDRRISDVIELAIAAGRNPFVRRELVRREHGPVPPILSLGLLPEGSPRQTLIDGPGNLRLGSEASWVDGNPKRNDKDIHFSIRMSPDGEVREPHHDRLIVEARRRDNRFPEFASRVVTPIVERKTRRGRDFELRVEQLHAAPDELVSYLRAPRHAAAFRIDDGLDPDGERMRLVVTGETPTLELVERADSMGWSILRYTDTATLKRLSEERPAIASFPDEIDLGSICSDDLHRGLATRGVDQRDVFRVSGDMVSEWLASLPPARREAARAEGRQRRSATRPFGDPDQDQLFTPDFVESADPAAQDLLALISAAGRRPPERRQMRRRGDMEKCWMEPSTGLQRYAIVDGVIPVIVLELQDHEAPVEDLFIIDGDLAVAALFRSRPFAVWARATLPAASSWMARFSIANTFGGFPIVAPFRVIRETHGRSVLTLDDNPMPIAELVLEVNQHIERAQAGGPLSNWKEAHHVHDAYPAMRRLDELILDAYGLKGDADDIAILRRLVEMNARME